MGTLYEALEGARLIRQDHLLIQLMFKASHSKPVECVGRIRPRPNHKVIWFKVNAEGVDPGIIIWSSEYGSIGGCLGVARRRRPW